MKKLRLIIIFTIFMLCPFFSAKAITKVNFTEVNNGMVDTTINFEEGFVGGIDVQFQITGNVNLKTFNFNNSYKVNNYTVNQKYDSNTKTLNIKVTTGGIGANHNLLNQQKILSLGTFVFEATGVENVDYSLNCQNLSFLDNSWKLKNILNEEISILDNSNFTYLVNKETDNKPNQEVDDKKDNDGNDTTSSNNKTENQNDNVNQNEVNNNQDNSSNNSNSNANSNTNSNGSSNSQKTPTNDKNTNQEVGDSNNIEPDNSTSDNDNNQIQDNVEENNDSNSNLNDNSYLNDENSKKDNKTVVILSVIVSTLAIIIVGSGIYLQYKSKKKKKLLMGRFDI